mgnify:CR=1 FL=1
MATGNNGSNNTTHIRSVNGAIQVQGIGPNNEKGGFRVGAFDPSGSAGDGGDASDQLGEGYLLAKKDIMTQKGLYAYARKGPTTQKGGPVPTTLFSKQGWISDTPGHVVQFTGHTSSKISSSMIKFPCRGHYRITIQAFAFELDGSQDMRAYLRVALADSGTTSSHFTSTWDSAHVIHVGNLLFSEDEDTGNTQDQTQSAIIDFVIDPVGHNAFTSEKADIWLHMDSLLGCTDFRIYGVTLQLIAPMASGAEYVYEG